jgi:hypothetical protein
VATNFPTSQDNFTNPTSSDTLDSPDHAAQHADVNDAVEALQAKVGVDSSAVTTSHDYKIAQLEANAVTDHGALTGLADDDHTQYLLADGTRTATALTVSGDVTVDTNTLHVHSTNNRVGVGTTSPSYKLDVNGDIRTTGAFYINTLKQGEWVSFTPVPLDYGSPAYTSSGSTTHNIGTSNSYYTATLDGYYMLSGNLCTVEYYGAYAGGNLTTTPMYSLPFLPEKGGGSNTGMHWYGFGNFTVFMNATYYLRPRISDNANVSSRKHVNGVVELRQVSGSSVSPYHLAETGTWYPPYGQNANTFTSGHVRLRIQYNIEL